MAVGTYQYFSRKLKFPRSLAHHFTSLFGAKPLPSKETGRMHRILACFGRDTRRRAGREVRWHRRPLSSEQYSYLQNCSVRSELSTVKAEPSSSRSCTTRHAPSPWSTAQASFCLRTPRLLNSTVNRAQHRKLALTTSSYCNTPPSSRYGHCPITHFHLPLTPSPLLAGNAAGSGSWRRMASRHACSLRLHSRALSPFQFGTEDMFCCSISG